MTNTAATAVIFPSSISDSFSSAKLCSGRRRLSPLPLSGRPPNQCASRLPSRCRPLDNAGSTRPSGARIGGSRSTRRGPLNVFQSPSSSAVGKIFSMMITSLPRRNVVGSRAESPPDYHLSQKSSGGGAIEAGGEFIR